MKCEVLGTQAVDYVSRKTGNPVKGVTLHVKHRDAQVYGEAVSNIFVSDNLGLDCIADVKPGYIIDVEYNNRGYVAGVTVFSKGTSVPAGK